MAKSGRRKTEEAIMQRRFCTCGNPVLVEYQVWTRGIVRSMFWRFDLRERGPISVCPCCGRRLTIDELA